MDNHPIEHSMPYNGPVHIYHLIKGAPSARGLTVVIDVFRAMSLECYLFDAGIRQIRPVRTIEEAFALRGDDPRTFIYGERKGRKCDGFDFGNSPTDVGPGVLNGDRVIHTTSAGTQGIANAVNADEIITGSLVNAKAVARYIISRQPKEVSLIAMGQGGVLPAAEDELCAEYIASLLRGEEMPDIRERIDALRLKGGDHFFRQHQQDIYPMSDFYLCTALNRFPFIIRVTKDEQGFLSTMVRPPF